MNGELLLSREELHLLSAADLRRALADNAESYGHNYAECLVSTLPVEHLDGDESGGPIELRWRQGALLLNLIHFAAWPEDGVEETRLAQLAQLLRPYLAHKQAELAAMTVVDAWSGPLNMAVHIYIALPWRGRSVSDVYRVGEEALKLCDALGAAAIDRESVADLVRGGYAELLVGQPEGNWLEAKAQEYDLTNTRGKVSLAQTVARFCNGEDGGLIVIGAHAKKSGAAKKFARCPE